MDKIFKERRECRTCRFARLMGYNQVICGKRNQWRVEGYTCDWWESKKENEDESAGILR